MTRTPQGKYPDNVGRGGEPKKSSFRPWIPTLLIAVILVIAACGYAAVRYWEPRARDALRDSLRKETGRTVIVEGFRLSLPISIDRIEIGGDDFVDSQPILVMRRLTVWPDVSSLFRFQPRAGLVAAESAVLRLKQRGSEWNTRGLFTGPPAEQPPILTFALPNTLLILDARDRHLERVLRVNIDCTSHGAFTLFFHGVEAHGRLNYTGYGPNAHYRLDVAMEDIPILDQRERFSVLADYVVDSQIVDFAINGRFLEKSVRLAGRVRFDTAHIRTDSGLWTWGAQSGRVLVTYNDLAGQKLEVQCVGRITAEAKKISSQFTSGTLNVDRMELTGPLPGPWQVTATVSGDGLNTAGTVDMAGGSVDATLTLDVGSNRLVRLVKTNARLKFAHARTTDLEVRSGEFTLQATPRQIEVSGRANTLGGAITVRNVLVGLDPDYQPTSVRGHMVLNSINPSEISGRAGNVVLTEITGDYEIAASRGQSGWRLERTVGHTDRAAGNYSGAPFVVSQAQITANGHPTAPGSSLSFDGHVSIFGGSGQLSASLAGGELVDAQIDIHDLDLAAANRVFHNPKLEAIAEHVDKVSMAGRLRFVAGDKGDRDGFMEFEGGVNADGLEISVEPNEAFADTSAFSIAPEVASETASEGAPKVAAPARRRSTARRSRARRVQKSIHANEDAQGGGGAEGGENPGAARLDPSLTTAMDIVSSFRLDGLPVRIRTRGRIRIGGSGETIRASGLELTIDTDRTIIQIPEATFLGNGYDAQLKIIRLDAEHLKTAAHHMAPNPYTDSLPIQGALSGNVHVVRTDEVTFASLDVLGDLLLRDSPFQFRAVGDVTNQSPAPALIVTIDTVTIDALHQTLADLDTRVDRHLMHWSGIAGATLTMTQSWDSLVIEGITHFHNASVDFPADSIVVKGINGELPFRLRKGQLQRLEAQESRPISFARLRYKDLWVDSIAARARFNERALTLDSMTFVLAHGRGEGAFGMNFPNWSSPMVAFFGRIKGSDLGILYDQMQPFNGRLGGKADATIQIKLDMSRTEKLQYLEVNSFVDSGIVGSELLKGILASMEQSMIKDALLSLLEWHFDTATVRMTFRPDIFSGDTITRLGASKGEIVVEIKVTGNVYPFKNARILYISTPFAWFPVKVNLVIENLPLNLLTSRTGRRTGP